MENTHPTIAGKPDDLNHPTPEEWISHLYGELSGPENSRLAAHLEKCRECQGVVAGWRRARTALDEWQLPVHRPARPARPMLKWAVAAALMLGLGLGLAGGLVIFNNTGARNVAAVRREMQAELKSQLDQQRAQILAEVRAVDQRNADDARATLAALREMNTAHRADYNSLHQELETVAVLTENSLRQAQQQIVHLAGYSSPGQNQDPNQIYSPR